MIAFVAGKGTKAVIIPQAAYDEKVVRGTEIQPPAYMLTYRLKEQQMFFLEDLVVDGQMATASREQRDRFNLIKGAEWLAQNRVMGFLRDGYYLFFELDDMEIG